MGRDDFFDRENCERCYSQLTSRTTSWFTTETICLTCSMWEDVIIEDSSKNRSELEGVGYIPETDIDVHWGEEVPQDL